MVVQEGAEGGGNLLKKKNSLSLALQEKVADGPVCFPEYFVDCQMHCFLGVDFSDVRLWLAIICWEGWH